MSFNSITIFELKQKIEKNEILLPAIQRDFVWKHEQIEALFDSLLQDFPINTFMFWRITSQDVMNTNKFYPILNTYKEKWGTRSQEIGHRTTAFDAVIDGQQRITAINIGICGSYAYKPKGKNFRSNYDSSIQPPRILHIDLFNNNTMLNSSGENCKYCFKFLTSEEAKNKNLDKKHFFVSISEIINKIGYRENKGYYDRINQLDIFNLYTDTDKSVIDNAKQILLKLCKVLFEEKVVNYYQIETQEADVALDLFVRTNSGGTKLEFSDLLMSIAIHNWNDAQNEIKNVIEAIRQNGFEVSKDWVLKACLYLIDAKVKYKVASFTADVVNNIKENWENIKKCIISTIEVLKKYGYADKSIPAKNSILTIAYYLYKNNLFNDIVNNHKLDNIRASITKWINIVILKHTFGNQSDNVLEEMRKIIKENLSEGEFPIAKMIEHYKGTPKDLRFDDATIDKILSYQKNNPYCYAVLMLLSPHLSRDGIYDIDHLHPEKYFKPVYLKEQEFLKQNNSLLEFYKDKNNWNSIPNLHLLNFSDNRGKNATPLIDWYKNASDFNKQQILVPENCSLEFNNFKNFYNQRKQLLVDKIKEKVDYTSDKLIFEEDFEEIKKEIKVKSNTSRDYTKYIFNGKPYAKNRLVEAVISEYIKKKSNIQFIQLEEVFPKKLQGPIGCFVKVTDDMNIDSKRFFRTKYYLSDSCKILICNQWGKGNIENFVKNAKKLGFQITEVNN